MITKLNTRNLVNAALGKKPSPQAQAILDAMKDLVDPPNALHSNETDNAADDEVEASEPTAPSNTPLTRKQALLQFIESKLAEPSTAEGPSEQRSPVSHDRVAPTPTQQSPVPSNQAKAGRVAATKPKPTTRAESNRINAAKSTGPKTAEGKAKVSANALKTGFFASVARLNPNDSPAYQTALDDLRQGLHPDGPAEDQLVRELAMLRARLLRLEATEYALICSEIESDPDDTRQVAAAYVNNAPHLDRLSKAETHLRRAYKHTWDRLLRMQRDRLNMPLDQALKQTQLHATYEALKTSCPQCVANGLQPPPKLPQRHPALDEKGKLITYEKGHPLHRPKENR